MLQLMEFQLQPNKEELPRERPYASAYGVSTSTYKSCDVNKKRAEVVPQPAEKLGFT